MPSNHHRIVPEYAYIKIMKIILQRGRLRWKRNTYNTNDSTTSSSSNSNNNSNNNNNNNNNIICAADQLEELLQEYESQSTLLSDSIPSSDTLATTTDTSKTTTGTSSTTSTTITTIIPPLGCSLEMYNLVLEAYAICATPRGERQYAQRAHALLQRMEQQQQGQQEVQSLQGMQSLREVYIDHDGSDSSSSTNTTTITDQNHSIVVTTNDTTHPNDYSQYRLPVESYLHVLHA